MLLITYDRKNISAIEKTFHNTLLEKEGKELFGFVIVSLLGTNHRLENNVKGIGKKRANGNTKIRNRSILSVSE